MEKTMEIDIGKLLQVLFKNLIWLIIGLAIGAAVFFTVSKFFMAPQYTSSVSLYVNNTTNKDNSGNVTINDINASQKLVNTYIVVLEHETVLEEVANQLMEEFSDDQLEEYIGLSEVNGQRVLKASTIKRVVSMASVQETEVLEIKAVTKNARLSARICNLIAEAAPEVLQRVVKAGAVEVIGAAKPATGPSSPNIQRYTLIGGLLGLLIVAAFVLMRALLDNTIKGEDDIRARLNIPVLGEIPDFETIGKGGTSYGR